MSRHAAPSPGDVLARARRQACLRIALLASPWVALCLWFAVRAGTPGWAWWPLLASLALAGVGLAMARGSRDRAWLAGTINAHPAFEDSAGLLLGLDAAASPIAGLQQSRLRQRWQDFDTARLLPRRPLAPLLWNFGVVLALAAAFWSWQRPIPDALTARLPAPLARALQARSPALAGIGLEVRPPAYTGLPRRSHDRGSIVVPEGSEVRWQVRFGVEPERAWLQFEQGPRIALEPVAGAWQATRAINTATLYRIVAEPALPPAHSGLHAIQVNRDQPPQVRATTPGRSLSLRTPGQVRWPLVFTASDDHGVSSRAELRIIQTSGEGENIASSERSFAISGTGGGRSKTFAYVFDLVRSGLTVGNDVIVQITVRDNRQPRPQVVRSDSMILRWPPEAVGLADGMDGLALRALPAYFRSQRQIIMDAEKLIRERPRLTADAFLQRSDAIGVDQNALRLRYGQFLGEEGAEPSRLPTNDVEEQGDDHPDHAAEMPAEARDEAHDAEHASGASDAEALLAQISHVHDVPEAATLLAPQTRDVLRAALGEMWQSELNLRQGQPAQALPFANRALAHIKQVQQADRIYLPRIGSEQAPIDFDRRLGGKRDGLAPRGNALVPKPMAASPLDSLWQALAADRDDRPIAPATLQAASTWLASRQDAGGHALAARAALDAVRQQPACYPCRQALRGALWPLLAPTVSRPAPRAAATPQGNAYLDALRRELRQ